ncbi:MAG TPA: nucleoside triphosphate pyrophosphohydrolase family protein [Gemmatimonadaceae bacterium]|nr:nucleoside triphosphate pyrophosphohydrolase family protein [Gemmatimonadaceae bacterium]
MTTLGGYQDEARRTINRALTEDERLLDAAAGLAEEAGEVLAHVRKHHFRGRPLDREALTLELGDALWCLAIAADTLGISLHDVARRNVEKLRARYPE